MPGESRCSPREIQKYLGRISGPMLDRIDIHVEVPSVAFQDLARGPVGESSAQIRRRVIAARQIQQKRFRAHRSITCNAHMGPRQLKAHCALDDAALQLLKVAMADMNLSARAYDRILKLARTIADLESAERIVPDHIGEAIGYRSMDRDIWT